MGGEIQKTAVLIMAYGGPDSLDDVEPYLLDVRGGRATAPELVAEIRARYARIGGHSPLLEITTTQANALEKSLNSLSSQENGKPGYQVFVGMRHWTPYIREAIQKISAGGFENGLALCMTPHASKMSTGIYRQKLRDALTAVPAPLQMNFIQSWYDQPFLINALAQKIRTAAQRFPNSVRPQIHYLFTAHSLPAAIQEQGDPYPGQLLQTANLLAQALGLDPSQWTFGYQSAGATPGQWLGPSIEEILPRFARDGIKDVLVAPVGFMADHVEVLFDLDVEAQEIAHREGIHLVRSESLNASPEFIDGLAKFILSSLASKNYEPV
jgi:protoporphyrin/coproporphyrin ferrochelatase